VSRLLVLVLLAACGPVFTVHRRTSPQRVSVTKQVSEPELVFGGRFVAPGQVELVAKQARDVRVTRVVHYGAASFEAGHYHPIIELVEIPFGLFFALLPPLWESPNILTGTPSTKLVLHNNWLVGMVNPFQTALLYHVRAIPGSNSNVFAAPPATREFRVSLPAPGLTLTYRALDDAERPLATGTIQTDTFGRATVPDVAGAIAFEVKVGSTTTVIPIEPEVAP